MQKQVNHRFFLLIAALFFSFGAQAQTRSVTGKMADEYEEPLVGGTVRLTTDHATGTYAGPA